MSRAPIRRPHRALLAAAFAVIAATLPAVPAAAGLAGDFTFETQVGGGCAGGYGASNQQIEVILKDKNGAALTSQTTYTEFGSGYWQACLERPVMGGQLLTVRYTSGDAHERTVNVPKVTATLNRATNVATGTAAPGASLMLELTTCKPGDCSIFSQVDITVPSSGTWSRSYNSANPGGGDKLRAYRVFGPDRFYAESYAPLLTVRATQPWNVSLIGRKGTVTVSDLKPNGDVRASLTTTFATNGFKLLPFKHKGVKTAPRAGDRIVSPSLAADVSMKLPSLKVTFDTAAHTVRATCFPNQLYQMLVEPLGFSSELHGGTAAADGSIVDTDVNVDGGGSVTIECEDKHGDRLFLRGSVPAP